MPLSINKIEDEFSKELIELWNKYRSFGYIHYILENNNIVGYCLVDNTTTIRGLFVDSNYRNKGLGTLILKDVINTYKETIVVNINKPAVNVYTRLGFKILGERNDMDLLIGYYGDLNEELEEKLTKRLKK